MTCYQDVFQRYEKKYLLDRRQYAAIRRGLEVRMREDSYGLHPICNIYFDTENFSVIRHSLDKPAYKEKLRLRSYGVPGVRDAVFLELKKKFDGVVYKRRIQMPLTEAYRYLLAGIYPAEDSQILREIDWFVQRNHPIPRAFIAYDRIAFAGIDDPETRITFDTGLRWRDTALDLTAGDRGYQLQKLGTALMEIKIPGVMPLWLSHLLAEHGVFPASFSKYGECYREHLLVKHPEGGNECA